MTEIKPALAAEEWSTPWGGMHSARGVDQQFTLHLLGEGGASKWLSIKLDGRVWNLREPDSFAVVMALANAALPDDDPRKITGDDVTTLLDVAYYATEGGADRTLRDRLANIIDRIAALLPP